ncbi:glycoside hydrolase 100 family protein [Arthrospiribacter ruber]|uniref:Fructofuranosidase/invertase n=1 Tax=Arthrospiribacter ruber TaxID=2487934 RepID=A0A951IZ99_9BACT|nr:glycoside hydrolase 100 family protein [Arthrospiribacter ruber]MBW3468123.1 fructofuranosidase/invertase [Arthrospiribacter ruber]
MDIQINQEKALSLIRKASHKMGFLASPLQKDNYQRIWARDGVITGIAALASREESLIYTFRQTLITLGNHASPQGHIPSNVSVNGQSVSYGGLAGRADTGSWWLIGLCLYAKYTEEKDLLERFEQEIEQAFQLYQAWEYNNRELVYVPLAGDWADEYVLHGYVFYDQVLRYAALKLCGQQMNRQDWVDKSEAIKIAIYQNYYLHPDWVNTGIHPSAKKRAIEEKGFSSCLMASFHPAGYQLYADFLGNALAMIFRIHPEPEACINWAYQKIGVFVPSFYPTILEEDPDFHLLKNNYRYEFRNRPFEFHNGGIWPMVNGFWGLATYLYKGKAEAEFICNNIAELNKLNKWEFNECFNGKTYQPCGVPQCTWSAAGQVLLSNTIQKGFYLMD